MTKTALSGVVLLIVGVAFPLSGQAIGAPGHVVGPNTFAPESRSSQPAYGTSGATKLNLSPQGFSPQQDGQWGTESNGWSARSGGFNDTQCANVHLPNGALLSGLTTYTDDTDIAANVRYALTVFDLNANTSFQPFVFETTGLPGIERIVHAIDPPIQIDNDDQAYTLCTAHGIAGTANQNAGATLWYHLQVSPSPGTTTFGDVPTDHPQFQFVEALAASGITVGCGSGNFCPEANLTRGQMAVFLSKALGLHFPN